LAAAAATVAYCRLNYRLRSPFYLSGNFALVIQELVADLRLDTKRKRRGRMAQSVCKHEYVMASNALIVLGGNKSAAILMYQ
jgi:hypothetical protein